MTSGLSKIILIAFLQISVFAQSDFIPKIDSSKQIIRHSYYILQYNEKYEQPDWVYYKLTKEEVENTKAKRKNNFRIDPEVKTGSATLADYRGSGFDRGHLAPAADMAFSPTAMSESFYMSNMSPQKPGFNRGIWKNLESLVRAWAVENDNLYIVTAGDLTKVNSFIGTNKVGVPSYYYKVILDYTEPEVKAIGFYLPNAKLSGDLSDYAVSVDYVENKTGQDFFCELPDNIENQLESAYDIKQWDFKPIKKKTKIKHNADIVSKININTATLTQLESLPGIKGVLSKRIIKARPFYKIEDLMKVKGIGKGRFSKIKDRVRVR